MKTLSTFTPSCPALCRASTSFLFGRQTWMAGTSPAMTQGAMTASKPQYRLRDDVLLDLVRAAIDRDLAPVEVLRRERRGVVRADRRLVPAVVVGMRHLVGQRVGADRLHQELGDVLLDLRSLDLEDRGGRVGLVALAVPLGRDDAQLRHLERLQLDLDRRDLHCETLVLDQRLVADALHR